MVLVHFNMPVVAFSLFPRNIAPVYLSDSDMVKLIQKMPISHKKQDTTDSTSRKKIPGAKPNF